MTVMAGAFARFAFGNRREASLRGTTSHTARPPLDPMHGVEFPVTYSCRATELTAALSDTWLAHTFLGSRLAPAFLYGCNLAS